MTRSLRYAIALAVALGGASAAHAQPYPAKPIRVIVPVAPGGGIDFVAHLPGQRLTEALGLWQIRLLWCWPSATASSWTRRSSRSWTRRSSSCAVQAGRCRWSPRRFDVLT